MSDFKMSEEQISRYSRQIRMPEIGEDGQRKLLSSKVLIIGAGGLGSPAALYLAATGVGTIGIADGDTVELSNMQRQLLHGMSDIGRAKTDSAVDAIHELDPAVQVVPYMLSVDSENLPDIVAGYDFVLECVDDFKTKLIINDACVKTGRPFCSGSVAGFYGQIITWLPGKGPCLRCVFRDPPDGAELSSENSGVLGASAGVIGCLQAAEAIKCLLGAGELLTGCLLTCDLLDMEYRKIPIRRDSACPVCGKSFSEEKE